MNDDTFVTKRITNQDVYKKLEDMEKRDREVLEHAKYTNGKVAEAVEKIAMIEKKSIGCWIARNPIKFAVYVLVFFSFVISDVRHPIVEMVARLFL